LNTHNVQYLIVGGYAIAFHSRPRFTDDIDIWIKASQENAVNVLHVLESFGFPTEGITPDDLSTHEKILQLGLPPQRIDILTSIDGVDFPDAWNNRIDGRFADIPVFILSLEDLMKNKIASARDKDLADLQWIKKYSGK